MTPILRPTGCFGLWTAAIASVNLDEVRDFDCVMGPKQLGRKPGVAGDPARMGGYGMLCALGPPNL